MSRQFDDDVTEPLLPGHASNYGTMSPARSMPAQQVVTPSGATKIQEKLVALVKQKIPEFHYAFQVIDNIANQRKLEILMRFLKDKTHISEEQFEAVIDMLNDPALGEKNQLYFLKKYDELGEDRGKIWEMLSSEAHIEQLEKLPFKTYTKTEGVSTVIYEEPFLVRAVEQFYRGSAPLAVIEINTIAKHFLQGVNKNTFEIIYAENLTRRSHFNENHTDMLAKLLALDLSAELAAYIVREDGNFGHLLKNPYSSEAVLSAAVTFFQNTNNENFLNAAAKKITLDPSLLQAVASNPHASEKTRSYLLASHDPAVLKTVVENTTDYSIVARAAKHAGLKEITDSRSKALNDAASVIINAILNVDIAQKRNEASTSFFKKTSNPFSEELQKILKDKNSLPEIVAYLKTELKKQSAHEENKALLSRCLTEISPDKLHAYMTHGETRVNGKPSVF